MDRKSNILFTGYNIEEFLGEGWHDIEGPDAQKWAWSKKTAFLRLPSGHNGIKLEIGGCPTGELTLYIDIYNEKGVKLNTYTVKKQANIVIPQGTESIKLEVSELWSPAEVLKAQDKRYLGICLNRIVPLKIYKEEYAWPPDVFEIETTKLCNINPPCVMCVRNNYSDRLNAEHISQNIINKLTPYFQDAQEASLCGIGEPLLYPTLFDILAIWKAKKVKTKFFNSNGILLSREMSERLISAELTHIIISLDAATPQTYQAIRRSTDFEKIKDNIRYLSKLKKHLGVSYPEVMISMVLMKNNLNELPDFIVLASELEVKNVPIRLLVPVSQNYIVDTPGFHFDYRKQMLDTNTNEFKEIILSAKNKALELGINLTSADHQICKILIDETVKPTGRHQGILRSWSDAEEEVYLTPLPPEPICKFPWERMIVYIDGQVSCCANMFHKTDSRGITLGTLGNLNTHEVEEIWNGQNAQKFRRQLLNSEFPEECRSCPIYTPSTK